MLTSTELATLKEEIKSEVMAELRENQKTSNWSKIRKSIEERLVNSNSYEKYKVINAISAIVRHGLGIEAVSKIQDIQVDRAREITFKVLDAMSQPTGTDCI